MSYIKVSIKDKQTLVLESDAKKGDLISLSELMHVDVTKIEQSIIDGTNQVYLKHEEEVKNNTNNHDKIIDIFVNRGIEKEELLNTLISKYIPLDKVYDEIEVVTEKKSKNGKGETDSYEKNNWICSGSGKHFCIERLRKKYRRIVGFCGSGHHCGGIRC